ncbi:DUF2219 family protein [Alphaproteobacteria bacterium KMM 3653]|uniref:DUF2219 family protein n=1 Tax=Harenicola maris TaxID=2841044 RepID=A0AAP2CQ38_9RHOB|nr:DUF2219 family protein [Harenicola maris]
MLRAAISLCAGVFCVVATAMPAAASDRVSLGWGRMFTNDTLGDGYDRWHTGSYTLSHVRGPEWAGALPGAAGVLLEYRARAELMTPANLTRAAAGDRRFASALSLGVHTHWQSGAYQMRAGGDLVFTGPQTGLDSIQADIHDALGVAEPSDAVLANQIGNAVYPTLGFEAAHQREVGGNARLRSFMEVQAGAESFVRLGFDLITGTYGHGGLLLRDSTTGQLYSGVKGEAQTGISFVLGADAAKVFDSVYLPSSDGYELTDLRLRARAGAEAQIGFATVFYGLTYLGEEFEAQPEGQLLGTLRISARF